MATKNFDKLQQPNQANQNTPIIMQRYYQLEKLRKAKTEDCKQAIPSSAPWTIINSNQQQQDSKQMNELQKIQIDQQQQLHAFVLNKEILLKHRPPPTSTKYNEKQNYHHILIPKQRHFFKILHDKDGDENNGHNTHRWLNCCFCCLCTCF